MIMILNIIIHYNTKTERSLRLIIDTGIHYFNWDYQKCFDYMKKYMKYY